ncbi:glutamine--fructose-6-phosphate transaminase (isomerizing) [Methanonatronarchaeum sp. AMET-Sl]|uniref:glutamine--fructose-6-phosphate transaminase (isomerizing) n=1 Tax=Methanonatronarchaeum sp. AMET-Sl TaxID=3037654 RepID=UPI00244DC840|nr:glutamine--fructose-6-phosphate transaminase (isomerizing) [Methanonatronarchaeum sp. AMET-Sl]WGI17666.1 glutamine--fructose-6-phosphate transaminase (isomerizing) [Methanonatronarchaeum sp. AMET-Sl]
MCGIIAYIGERNATPILINSLEKLTYRGYDSTGIAIKNTTQLNVFKKKGKIKNIKFPDYKGELGLGHNRWATHGEPSDRNAHPHTSCNNEIAVVHNGIIENYQELKKELDSHIFDSDTDTEVIPHLIEENLHKGFIEAFQETVSRLEGAYAIVAIKKDEDQVLVARKQSPLIIGVGENETFVASDIPAFLEHTDKVIILEDDETASITKNQLKIMDKNGNEIEKEVREVGWDAEEAEKSGYKHYMLKEIHEQPRSIRKCISGRIDEVKGKIELNHEKTLKNNFNGIQVIGCGTSYHAGLYAKYLFEELASIPTEVIHSSEYRYKNIARNNYLALTITQSGETADTLSALKKAKQHGLKTLALTNVLGSTASREADYTTYIKAGPEIGVAASKTFTSQLTALTLLATHLARQNNNISIQTSKSLLTELRKLPTKIQTVLDNSQKIEKLAEKHLNSQAHFFIGRNINYPVALEAALKLKEISYKHAEGFPAGELKHGPLALVQQNTPVIAIATKDKTYEKTLSNIKEVEARNAPTIAIANQNDTEINKYVTQTIKIPQTNPILSPILTTVALQLYSYHIANKLNRDIDQPRNLAKSVTVE